MVRRGPVSAGAANLPTGAGTSTPKPATLSPQTGGKPSSRAGKRVLSVFITPEAWKQLRTLAIEEETTTQALGIEAVNMLFAARQKNRIA